MPAEDTKSNLVIEVLGTPGGPGKPEVLSSFFSHLFDRAVVEHRSQPASGVRLVNAKRPEAFIHEVAKADHFPIFQCKEYLVALRVLPQSVESDTKQVAGIVPPEELEKQEDVAWLKNARRKSGCLQLTESFLHRVGYAEIDNGSAHAVNALHLRIAIRPEEFMCDAIGVEVDAGDEVVRCIIRYVNFFDSLLQQEALGSGQHLSANSLALPFGMHKKCSDPPATGFHADIEIGVAPGQTEHEPDDLGIGHSHETPAGIKVGIKYDLPTKCIQRYFVTRETMVPQRDDAQLILCLILPDL